MIRFGNDINYWIQSESEVDLSRGAETALVIETSTLPIRFDPKRSAFVVIDMQNFFLSERLGRPASGRAIIPQTHTVIEFARKMGMKIVWLNWGVREDLANMPPGVLRSFYRTGVYSGFGSELPDGLGKLLVKGSWSARLIDSLAEVKRPDDIWIDKNRTSGFFGTDFDQILQTQGITTLFFAGVNTDQCVMGTLQDAFCIGYDCILVSDCTATTSPIGAYESALYNVERSYGFVMKSEQFCQAKKKFGNK